MHEAMHDLPLMNRMIASNLTKLYLRLHSTRTMLMLLFILLNTGMYTLLGKWLEKCFRVSKNIWLSNVLNTNVNLTQALLTLRKFNLLVEQLNQLKIGL